MTSEHVSVEHGAWSREPEAKLKTYKLTDLKLLAANHRGPGPACAGLASGLKKEESIEELDARREAWGCGRKLVYGSNHGLSAGPAVRGTTLRVLLGC